MQVKREFIKPKTAEKYLELNRINRTVKDPRVEVYADMMRRGLWNFGHDDAPVGNIVFNGDGTLLDGGHRLAAVVKAGVGQWFMVERGMPTENALLHDRGAPKSYPDLIRTYCLSQKQEVPAFLFELCAALNLFIRHKLTPGQQRGANSPWKSPIVQLEYFKKYGKRLQVFVERASNIRALMPVSAAAVVWMLAAEKDAEMADEFFEKLKTGEGIASGEPVGVLRNRLIADRALSGVQLRTDDLIERVIRTWNATRAGKRWHRVEANTGAYPAIQ